MRVRVVVTLKREVLDPQGEAVRRGLEALGVAGLGGVRVGKVIDLELEGTREALEPALMDAGKRLLSNPIIEDFALEWP